MKVKLNEITSQEKYIKEQNRTKWNQRDFIAICKSDPTYDAQTDKVGKYTNWMLATLQSINDLNTVITPLEWYADGAKRGILRRYNIPTDINTFKTVDELITTMRSIMQNTDSQMSNSELNNRKKLEGQFKVISSNEDYEIIQTFTFKSERYFGSGTEWCTVANEDYFDNYNGASGELFIFYPRNGKKEMKMQFHVDSDSYATYDDEVLSTPKECIINCADSNGLDENFIKRTCELSNSTRLFKEIHYYTFEDAVKLLENGSDPKKIFDEVYEFDEGFARVELNSKCNFLTKDGKLLLKQWFDGVRGFSEGFATVYLNYKFNYIDTNGKLISNQWFDWVEKYFSEGFARINLKGKDNFINTKGQIISPNQWFDNAEDFNEGFARVRLNNKYNFLTKDGNILSNQWFESVRGFSEGFATVKLNGKWNFINEEGQIAFSNQWFDSIGSFNEGLAIVELNRKFNFVTQDGNFLSKQWFDYADSFREGFARIMLNGKHNIIDTDGKFLSKQWFDYVFKFRNNFARVELNDKSNFLTKDGSLLSDQWFDDVSDFRGGFAKVRLNYNVFAIDGNGQLYDYKTKEPIMEQRNRLKQIVQEEITKSDEKRIKEIVADSVSELFKALWQKNNFWKSDIKK